MSNDYKAKIVAKRFDLEERTAAFGEGIIAFVNKLPHERVIDVLVKQVVRSGTSVGANYMEADAAESKKDFCHKLALCRKEIKETKHWLRMIAKAKPDESENCRALWTEAQELTRIFSTIITSTNKK